MLEKYSIKKFNQACCYITCFFTTQKFKCPFSYFFFQLRISVPVGHFVVAFLRGIVKHKLVENGATCQKKVVVPPHLINILRSGCLQTRSGVSICWTVIYDCLLVLCYRIVCSCEQDKKYLYHFSTSHRPKKKIGEISQHFLECISNTCPDKTKFSLSWSDYLSLILSNQLQNLGNWVKLFLADILQECMKKNTHAFLPHLIFLEWMCAHTHTLFLIYAASRMENVLSFGKTQCGKK